jgi:hypothetical protein
VQAIFDSISNVQEGTIFRWTALLIGQAVIVFTVIMGYLGTRKKVSDVSDQATKAAELAEPTGNGFAKDMRDSMKFLSDAILRVEDKVDTHIQDHARQSLKD